MSTEVGKAGLVSPPRVEDYAERQLSLAKREMIQFSSCLHGCWIWEDNSKIKNQETSRLRHWTSRTGVKLNCRGLCISTYPSWNPGCRGVNRLPWGHFLVQARDQLSPKTSPTQEERSRNSAKTTARRIFISELPEILTTPTRVPVPRITLMHKQRTEIRRNIGSSATRAALPLLTHLRFHVDLPQTLVRSEHAVQSRARKRQSRAVACSRVSAREFKRRRQCAVPRASSAIHATFMGVLRICAGLSRSPSRSRSRSKSSERTDLELLGRVEEIEFQAEQSRNDLNARLLVSNGMFPHFPPLPGRTLAALQVAISRLEITSAAPLVLRTHGILPQRSHSPPRLNHQPFRTRSRSPPQGHASKRLRLDDPNGFIAFGPSRVGRNPQKQFELYLRTAIPHFRLEAPYTVRSDSDYTGHLRVTVKSAQVARALIDAWAKQTVAAIPKSGWWKWQRHMERKGR
ncbi:hypothetical protein K438DRAFT_1776697 [Mycena galopus ATCC 62051]|nr:hypothetical protein K438DRAFT_1776697 [Mycena galopus ATCC 62051]